MSPKIRGRLPWLAVGAACLVLVLVLGGLLQARGRAAKTADRGAHAAATAFVAAWQRHSLASVSYNGGSPAAVQSSFVTLTKGLAGARPTVSLAGLTRSGTVARGNARVSWALAGGAVWTYDVPFGLVESAGHWSVQASSPHGGQSLFAPVPATARLQLQRTPAARGQVLGAGGQVLVTARPVVDIGVEPGLVKGDPATLAARLGQLLGVQAGPLDAQIKAAGKTSFVDVITLRRSDYDGVRAALRSLPGVVLRDRMQSLAPTRRFARALLGSVGPVTADIVSASRGRYSAGDLAGVSGLQRQYDTLLAGRPGVRVLAVPATGGPGRQVFAAAPTPGRPLGLTLDTRVQLAADAALAGSKVDAALVAVDVRTGAVLAIANSPASGLNRAMLGQYPPGSTFKVVSTLALLATGLKPTDTVQCPPTATVDGRVFRNYESERLGPVPFRTDFAMSCNTAFVGLSARLGDGDLATAARSVGIGRQWRLGTGVFSGNVPRPTSAVEKAAEIFGQGRILTSPLALAVATASVARGSYVDPTLVLEPSPGPQPAAEPLPAPQVATLRALMRGVVTSGTATVLRSVPGGPVSAKTGTAEFGGAVPPQTHAWMTGWQGNLAFTVFVHSGKSGGTVAGPVAARFLTMLARG